MLTVCRWRKARRAQLSTVSEFERAKIAVNGTSSISVSTNEITIAFRLVVIIQGWDLHSAQTGVLHTAGTHARHARHCYPNHARASASGQSQISIRYVGCCTTRLGLRPVDIAAGGALR